MCQTTTDRGRKTEPSIRGGKTPFSVSRHMAVLLVCAIFLSFLAGCASQGMHASMPPAPVMHEAPPIPPPAPSPPGSLWTNRRGSMFYDLKARNVGDIVTVAISETASASKEATTETNRETETSADLTKMLGLEKALGQITKAEPTSLLSAKTKNDFKGEGSTVRKENLLATITTQVTSVLPNGNFRIQGGKTVTVNNESQIIQLTGIIRPEDISAQNIINSKYVLDARIAYVGKGPISDKQQPGWMTRMVDKVWPF